MTSFPKAVGGAIGVGLLYQVLVFNFPNETGLVQFVLFLIVLVLVARMSRGRRRRRRELLVRAARPAGAGTAARDLVGAAHAAARRRRRARSSRSCCRSSCTQSARHLTYAMILAFAICAVSVTVLTGWGGQLSLGQMAFAGIGALSGAAFARGVTLNIGWRSHRLVNGAIQPFPFVMTIGLGVVAIAASRRSRRRAMAGAAARASRSAAIVVAARRCEPLFVGQHRSGRRCGRCRSCSTSSSARSSRACSRCSSGPARCA